MKRYGLALAVLVLVVGTSGVVAAESGPLADAGLDQEVTVDTTVQLDATGSSHPNGTIDGYEWSIETPGGRAIRPDCEDCPRTQFSPGRTGRYDVTVTVTDTEGRSDEDTLYVYVENAGPAVALDGPTEPSAGEAATYNATATSRNTTLKDLTWQIDGRTVGNDAMAGRSDHSERTFRFPDSGPYRLEVVVNDSENRTARDVLVVKPESPSRDNDSDSTGGTERDDLGSGGTDNDRTCTQAAAVGTDYVCIEYDEQGGGEDLVDSETSEVCDGTDLSTCDTRDDPAGGTTRGSDSDIDSSGGSSDSDASMESLDNIPGANSDEGAGSSDAASDNSPTGFDSGLGEIV